VSRAIAAAELMDALAARGVRFGLRAGRLVLDAPHGVLTPEVRAAVAVQKAAIERLVRVANGLQPPATPTVLPCPVRRCRSCQTRRWWQRADGGWVCGVCHPPVTNVIGKQSNRPLRLRVGERTPVDHNESAAQGERDVRYG